MAELESVLSSCGVQRVVLWHSDIGDEVAGELKAVPKLGYTPLDPVDLAGYKAALPSYHRDFVGGTCFQKKDII
jgi:hypothetical protein